MRLVKASRRTKLVYAAFVAGFAIGAALIIALLVGFTGVWLEGQVPQITVLIIYAGITLLLLRIALAWSMRADGR